MKILTAIMILMVGSDAMAQQKVLFDIGPVVLRQGGTLDPGGYYSTEYQSHFPIPHFNWLSPVNYRDGRLYQRLDVIERTSAAPYLSNQQMQEPGYNGDHWWNNMPQVTGPDIHYRDYAFTSCRDATNLMDRMANPPNLRCAYAQRVGSHNAAWTDPDYFPTTVRLTWVIVAAGATFTGWDKVVGADRPIPDPLPSKYAGTYRNQITVTLKSYTPGAQIYYTTNGTTPTTASTLYKGPFILSKSTTIKAKAFKSGVTSSDVTTALYTINDAAKPKVISATGWGNKNTVKVVFNEPVDKTSAETISNYTFSGVTVSQAALGSDGRTVTLTTTDLAEGQGYSLTVSGIKDLAASPNTMAQVQRTVVYRAGYYDDFDGGAKLSWAPKTAGNWSETEDLGSGVYNLNTTDFQPDRGRPGEYVLLNTVKAKAFSLETAIRSTEDRKSNQALDLGLIFGYVDYDNFYYLLAGTMTSYSRVYKIADGIRSTILECATPLLDSTNFDHYNSLQVVSTGTKLTVYLNGVERGSVNESIVADGQVGLCSYNDGALFDNFAFQPENGTGIALCHNQPAGLSSILNRQKQYFTLTGSRVQHSERSGVLIYRIPKGSGYITGKTIVLPTK